jgi:hypothetical protein
VGVNLAEPEEQGTVNVAMRSREEGWGTLAESWLDMKAIKDGRNSL